MKYLFYLLHMLLLRKLIFITIIAILVTLIINSAFLRPKMVSMF